MKRSLLIFSAWISLVFMASSCFSPRIVITGEKAASYDKSMQAGKNDKMTYKAMVTYKDQELSGRVIVKQIQGDTYRVAFFNELGMTYLEGELDKSSSKNKLIIHNIMPVLDNKMFLRKFGKSVREMIE
jgi:hypothetical protein